MGHLLRLVVETEFGSNDNSGGINIILIYMLCIPFFLEID